MNDYSCGWLPGRTRVEVVVVWSPGAVVVEHLDEAGGLADLFPPDDPVRWVERAS